MGVAVASFGSSVSVQAANGTGGSRGHGSGIGMVTAVRIRGDNVINIIDGVPFHDGDVFITVADFLSATITEGKIVSAARIVVCPIANLKRGVCHRVINQIRGFVENLVPVDLRDLAVITDDTDGAIPKSGAGIGIINKIREHRRPAIEIKC